MKEDQEDASTKCIKCLSSKTEKASVISIKGFVLMPWLVKIRVGGQQILSQDSL